MSALARYYHALGYLVAGYDKTTSPLLTDLQTIGIEVVYDESVGAIPASISACKIDEVLWVYTPAIPKDHQQLLWLQKEKADLLKRAAVLGQITKGRTTLAVAGTHGKTTTSTLLAHLLIEGGVDCTAFLGGISTNYGVNYIQAKDPDNAPVVVEADEFDRSFLQLQPTKAIITSVDADHLDIYGEADAFREGFEAFSQLVPPDGLLVQKAGLNLKTNAKSLTYAVELSSDFTAQNIQIARGTYTFDLFTSTGVIPNLSLGLPGRHNMENAVAASAIALSMGVLESDLKRGLASFRGVKRRFEYVVKRKEHVYIDDYAHHPEELKACIRSVKELYPDQKITGVFQPHLFTRTRDFMDAFAASLSLLDICILMPIYPAREKPIEGVNSQALLRLISCNEKTVLSSQEVVDYVKRKQPPLLLTLGAGDIDRIVPQLKEVLV
ncbi:MAG: UDP-N-acetylmuramate--L-alanine ligase [Bacteroidetes bacterium]|nr:UDP-N-acetylmuramate--L-alanine ligase [Bacteroidota bacterium]